MGSSTYPEKHTGPLFWKPAEKQNSQVLQPRKSHISDTLEHWSQKGSEDHKNQQRLISSPNPDSQL